MRILLTGSSGFLGSVICESISHEKIYTLNRKEGQFQIDLSKIVPAFEVRFDIIIHNAGLAHVRPRSDFESSSFYKTNIDITKNLLKSLESVRPKKFVFISSVAVYGLSSGTLINDTSPLTAKDWYGRSKIDSEILIKDWCRKYDVVCTILRLPLVIGKNPVGNLKSMMSGIKKGYYFDIGSDQVRRSMVSARDVARVILKASDVGGVFILTDGYHPSLRELSVFLSVQFGKRKPKILPYWIARFLAKVGDLLGPLELLNSEKLEKMTATLTFDDSKARECFGWNPTPVLKDNSILE